MKSREFERMNPKGRRRFLKLMGAALAARMSDPHFSRVLQAISIAAVFFGACTYIGNGPNFMVKAIADRQKVHTPGFLGFILRFTLPFMVPMLVLVWWLFFRS